MDINGFNIQIRLNVFSSTHWWHISFIINQCNHLFLCQQFQFFVFEQFLLHRCFFHWLPIREHIKKQQQRQQQSSIKLKYDIDNLVIIKLYYFMNLFHISKQLILFYFLSINVVNENEISHFITILIFFSPADQIRR